MNRQSRTTIQYTRFFKIKKSNKHPFVNVNLKSPSVKKSAILINREQVSRFPPFEGSSKHKLKATWLVCAVFALMLGNVRTASAVDGYCHFYEHSNYGGKRLDVKISSYNTLHNGSMRWATGSGKPGDRISSVSCDGVTMTVYAHTQWRGNRLRIEGKIPNLHSIGWGDKISSIGNRGVGCCNLYKHANYRGYLGNTCESFGNGYMNSTASVGWGDNISSVQCAEPIIACEHAQWKGRCKSLYGNIPSLHRSEWGHLGDKISSFR